MFVKAALVDHPNTMNSFASCSHQAVIVDLHTVTVQHPYRLVGMIACQHVAKMSHLDQYELSSIPSALNSSSCVWIHLLVIALTPSPRTALLLMREYMQQICHFSRFYDISPPRKLLSRTRS